MLAAVFNRWRSWMFGRGSAKMVYRDGKPYLERHYLLAIGNGRLRNSFLFRKRKLKVFFHTFWMSDPDPLHDHPWDWGRVIVRGSYREFYLDGTFRDFGPGHVVWRRNAECLHRVELLTSSVCTIFWHWRRRRTWGFLHPEGWRPTPDEGQDGRPLVGTLFPRKIGPAPKEVTHT